MGSWFFNIPSPPSKCAGLEGDGPPILQVVYVAAILTALSCGIYYDILLSKFLKKKNNSVGPGGSRLIPWKSGGQEYSLLIPISATITATVVSFVSTFMTGFSVVMILKSQVKLVMVCANVQTSLESIAILGLTLRAALKNKKQKPVIPRGPMFHDDEEIELRTISASVERNNVNVTQAIATLPNQVV